MSSKRKMDALFIGYENQENLGLRYICAYLEKNGYKCEIIPFKPEDPYYVLESIKQNSPVLVGFSIIFQYNINEFGELMSFLRSNKTDIHFTAGGHYPSLRPERTFRELKHLDSIVRFEGEITTAELLEKINTPQEWSSIMGLAFRDQEKIVLNRARPLLANLDELPWPKRGELRQSSRGIGMAPILASRGCLHNCSFCSIRQFYRSAPGPLRRSRSPQDVAKEMNYLFREKGVRLFLFQDDDFAAKSKHQLDWIESFLHELTNLKLKDKIGWKISCRVDDIDSDVISRCRDHGLLVVYLGIESGNEKGLEVLNKRVTVDQNLAAIQILKDTGVEFDMGFMLFDPGSTIESVRRNINFLKQVADFRGPPISFVKMLPLAGTEIEKKLAGAGRLTGDDIRPDYNLTDPRLEYYALFVTLNFSYRNSSPSGLVERLRQAYFDYLIVRKFANNSRADEYRKILRRLCDRSNQSVLYVLEQALDLVETCPDSESVALSWHRLQDLARYEQQVRSEIIQELMETLKVFNPGLHKAYEERMPLQGH